ncbi:MAG: hypothetical protein A3D31_05405 [Candidatus Fluviicola riflensis]|nr:MAG: hypothetical protein CHH17_09610 [Candidatus Fluviicola riflensis]OGS79406.1 MAG: hypothetical protein A3D31_05405 [Candidatus Fluviicola riflensis]OGS86838.1 MAG: hypothetical protein A2724_04865 [Fluviicola sp. RIFCSPHIGHO2_01_FULL_43_53]OGS89628.1 MAG: hypothetical protein A3E30_01610 [Fluviicola sp. RIFCSPHIGHO2_12_FULL_43_24]
MPVVAQTSGKANKKHSKYNLPVMEVRSSSNQSCNGIKNRMLSGWKKKTSFEATNGVGFNIENTGIDTVNSFISEDVQFKSTISNY